MKRLLLCKLLILLASIKVNATDSQSFIKGDSPIEVSSQFSQEDRDLLLKAISLEGAQKWTPLTPQESLIWPENPTEVSARKMWLNERIHLIFPFSQTTEISEGNIKPYTVFIGTNETTYPYPNLFPSHPFNEFNYHRGESNLGISNISPEIYLKGKKEQKLAYFLNNPNNGHQLIPITSPRIGLIKMKPSAIKKLRVFSPKANQILMVSLLFHEARHGDGHGRHLGFPHTLCPQGHDYAGRLACDTPLNGAYGIQSLFIQKTLEACESCQPYEKEILRFSQVEAQNRVLTKKKEDLNREQILELENQITELSMIYFNEIDKVVLEEVAKKIYALNAKLEGLLNQEQKEDKLILDPKPEKVIRDEKKTL